MGLWPERIRDEWGGKAQHCWTGLVTRLEMPDDHCENFDTALVISGPVTSIDSRWWRISLA